MNIGGQRILVTGAGGGIGSAIALELAERGVELFLVDRQLQGLERIKSAIEAVGSRVHLVVCDLTAPDAAQIISKQAVAVMGAVDVLINCAGISSFGAFADETPDGMERLWRINTLVPMQLASALLPHMITRGSGRIVNIGSIFGSIGFAYFASYSASKFAMRGFSESLRRELQGSGVGVIYVAPRFTRTPLNDDAVNRMAQAVGMNSDDPATVARLVVRAIEKDRKDSYIGWPERLFVRINAILPRLVDSALRRQNTQMRKFVNSAAIESLI